MTDNITAAYDQWNSDPSSENTKKLMETLTPQIDSALRAFAPGMENSLKLRATTMTLKALPKYDRNKGLHLKSFVYQQLQPLQREFGKRVNPLQVPERHIMELKALNKYETDFFDANGREPSVSELADYSGMSIDRITKIRAGKLSNSESQTISAETGDSMFSVANDPQKNWAHYVYYSLDPVDQKIYEYVTGFGGSKQLKKGEIAQKLKISNAAVSQRINKIVGKLQEGINLGE